MNNQKFALITDQDKTFSTDTGFKVVTYGSAYDNMGWTALKELSGDAAFAVGVALANDGYVVVRSENELAYQREKEPRGSPGVCA